MSFCGVTEGDRMFRLGWEPELYTVAGMLMSTAKWFSCCVLPERLYIYGCRCNLQIQYQLEGGRHHWVCSGGCSLWRHHSLNCFGDVFYLPLESGVVLYLLVQYKIHRFCLDVA